MVIQKAKTMEIKIKYSLFLNAGLFFLASLFNSCEREETQLEAEGGKASVIFATAVSNGSTNAEVKTKASAAKASNDAHRSIIPVGGGYALEWVLTESSPDQGAPKVGSTVNRANAGRLAVEGGIRYAVTYYDKDGTYKGYNRFVVGNSTPISGGEHTFDAGKPYTFIFQSNHTKTYEVGLPASSLSLNNAVVDGLLSRSGGQDLDQMYARVDRVLDAGTNYINVLFEHLFSQITVSLDTKEIGDINSLGVWRMSPHYNAFSLKVSDASVQYKSADIISGGKTVTLVSDATKKFAQSSAFMIAAPDGLGTLKIDGLQVGGEVKNLTIPNVPLEKGKSYDLSLTLKKGSTVINGLEWAPGNLIESNNVYSFANTLDLGTAFGWRSFRSGETYAYNPVGDPCTRANINGGGWRTPSHADWQSIFIGSTKTLVTENGKQGVRVVKGSSSVVLPKTPDLAWGSAQIPSSTLWSRTRAPISISFSGFYWAFGSRDYFGTMHGNQWRVSESSTGFDTSFRTSPSYVRCVRGTVATN